ncbi:uncharacterized protein BJ171DRAFT_601039 [Polychytrium aggregatum]|uniref:uncharacterized protein n=1 Tax=Polychytrium aggregatum TaxID=110093 RepID=UPI0022FECD0F|nr:uncharacterized protein BJ171DRAFT_601039 [Polychytrium aggregatum]KAI9202354.1 hypothetical protein BJ171DRAFT_601039 [Polychytrium aggregatum]
MRSFLAVLLLAWSGTIVSAEPSEWAERRFYYSEASCPGSGPDPITIGSSATVTLFWPSEACQGPVQSPCQDRTGSSPFGASERTVCEPLSSALSAFTSGQAPADSHLVVSEFTHRGNVHTCALTTDTVQLVQKVFRADNRCHAIEPGWFARAKCDDLGGMLWTCIDSECISNCQLRHYSSSECSVDSEGAVVGMHCVRGTVPPAPDPVHSLNMTL